MNIPIRPELATTIASYDKHGRPGWSQRDIVAPLTDTIGHGSIILDVGAGTGVAMAALGRTGWVVGSDLSDNMVRQAAQHGPVTRADMRQLPHPDHTFDAIWAMAALVHLTVDETRAAAAELARVCRPGGKMYLTLKARVGQEAPEATVSDAGGDRWFHFWSEPEIRTLLPGNVTTIRCQTQPSWSRPGTAIWWEILAEKNDL